MHQILRNIGQYNVCGGTATLKVELFWYHDFKLWFEEFIKSLRIVFEIKNQQMNADWCTSNGSDHWAGQQVLASFLLFCQLDNYVMPPLDAVLIELLGGSGRKDAARHVAVVLWTTFRGPIGDVVSGPLWSHSRRFGLFWFDCLKNHVSEKLWPLATKRVGRERRQKKV